MDNRSINDVLAIYVPCHALLKCHLNAQYHYRPDAQISVRTAFIVQGNSVNEEALNTNNT
ncbi:hypothetical protein [uncultured Mucilaginibacter sp.]|uniref:hypothetical protein n=1 Tax=uncultured Mucilaginibacter sp. TaxID=797541 RepID=UPI0025E1FBED|nr:hypothetical protein [uncultured Mucilaginibacter sp.]